MASVVQVLCTPHDPTLPGVAARGAAAPEPLQRTIAQFAQLRQRLAAARPDVLVVVAGDHFNQWFYDNMPTFLIGKAARARGPFPHEQHLFGIAPYDTALEGDLARHLLRQGLQRGIDFASSDDFLLDHGFSVPLNFLRPEQDLPVVPVFTNVMAPPVASGRRFHDLGAAVVEMIEAHPADLRVAVIASGHLSNAIGGPAMMRFATEPAPEWDLRVWRQLTDGDTDRLIAESTYETLAAQGSGTPGFLDYLFALGAVGGDAPAHAELIASPFGPPAGFLAWGGQAMSRYATNRVLWEAAADPELARAIQVDPQMALAGRELTEEEHTALGKSDIRGLFELGVHPFLLYNFALRLAGGFSMPFVESYVAQLEGLHVHDIQT